jgi:hypothetical protein
MSEIVEVEMYDTTIPEVFRSSDIIFHYTKASTALEKILYDGFLRLAQRTDSGDPQEYRELELGSEFIVNDRVLAESIRAAGQEALKIIPRIISQNVRQICFCMNTNQVETGSPDIQEEILIDQYGFFRPRMWSQYGDGHRGICLAFSRAELVKAILATKESEDRVFEGNIKYFQGFPGGYFIGANDAYKKGPEKYAQDYIEQIADGLLLTKHADYRDEYEYRISVVDNSGSLEWLPIANAIRGIILGERFPDTYSCVVHEFEKQYRVPAVSILWERGTPCIIRYVEDQ